MNYTCNYFKAKITNIKEKKEVFTFQETCEINFDHSSNSCLKFPTQDLTLLLYHFGTFKTQRFTPFFKRTELCSNTVHILGFSNGYIYIPVSSQWFDEWK